jgi:hypothetical protein
MRILIEIMGDFVSVPSTVKGRGFLGFEQAVTQAVDSRNIIDPHFPNGDLRASRLRCFSHQKLKS